MRPILRPFEAINADYNNFHKNPFNRWTHRIAVPLINFSLFGLLSCIPLPFGLEPSLFVNWGVFTMILSMFYFAYYGVKISIIMVLFYLFLLVPMALMSQMATDLFMSYLYVFIFAWIIQLFGHYVEGRRPAFLDDLSTLPLGFVLVYFANKDQ